MKEMKELFAPPSPAPLPPGLYLVSTPIGNLRDITLRALDVLGGVDRIACEDSRVTARLLAAFGLKKPLVVYNDHTGEKDREKIMEALRAGGRLALVSDAGTPLVSDPGYRLVQTCLAEGVPVTTLPGANAILSALQLSGLPCDRFSFGGFLPPRSAARRKALDSWVGIPGALIFYETAPRLAESLSDMKKILGDRPAAVVREITKLFEETRRGSLTELVIFYTEKGPPKGEIVVVVGPPSQSPEDDAERAEELDGLLTTALEAQSLRDAVDSVSALTGLPRKRVYARALTLSKAPGDEV
jgi:16S rRNA (cytidine1402-2'-O)-methyltransferase